MTKQTEAQRLADALHQEAVWEDHYGPSKLRDLLLNSAAIIRRQDELIVKSLHALVGSLENENWDLAHEDTLAAIAALREHLG